VKRLGNGETFLIRAAPARGDLRRRETYNDLIEAELL